MPDEIKPEAEWIVIEDGFAVGDVLRWSENIWSDRKKGRGKAAKHKLLGKQQVTGQITAIDREYVTIEVIAAEILQSETAKPLRPYKTEQILRKKSQTLLKGKAERLLWEEESSRVIFRAAARN